MNLNIKYEELSVIARNLITKAQDFETLVRDVNNINRSISECWQGADAAKYLEAVNVQNTYMAQLATVIADIGNYLNGVGIAYQDAVAKNANSVQL